MGYFITVLVFLSLFMYLFYRRSKRKKAKEKAIKKFKSIDTFNEDSYISSVIESALYSVLHSEDWESTLKSGDIIFFSKKNDKHRNNNHIRIDYETKNKDFVIKDIYLEHQGISHKFTGIVSDDLDEYIYSIYYKQKTLINTNLKEQTDKKLVLINEYFFDQKTDRDKKINNILN